MSKTNINAVRASNYSIVSKASKRFKLRWQMLIDQEFFVTDSSKTAERSPELFKEKLLQQQALLERTMLTAVKEGRESSSDDLQDAADHAVQSYQKELLFLQGTNGHVQLTQVRSALGRLGDGSFGECLHCGNTIGEKRLEAVPWTPYCIACQEKIENGEMIDPVQAA